MNTQRKHREAAWATLLTLVCAIGPTHPLFTMLALALARRTPAPPRLLEIAVVLWTFAVGVVVFRYWQLV